MGDLERAAAHFEDALTFCRNAGFLPELAWTCHAFGNMLLAESNSLSPFQDDETRGTSLLQEALAISSELGMLPLRNRVAALQAQANSEAVNKALEAGGLTTREVEVLTHLAQGMTDREIANELMISIRTVQRHISNIYNKINVRNRTEATTFALSHFTF